MELYDVEVIRFHATQALFNARAYILTAEVMGLSPVVGNVRGLDGTAAFAGKMEFNTAVSNMFAD